MRVVSSGELTLLRVKPAGGVSDPRELVSRVNQFEIDAARWYLGGNPVTNTRHRMLLIILLLTICAAQLAVAVDLRPADTKDGYIARLLINEAPFPGERGWVSEADTKATMLSILWVLHSRIYNIPPGYKQQHIAAVRTGDIIDVITVGGEKGQCDGFYRDGNGKPMAVPRVHKRIDYLMKIGNEGTPGKFARLLEYGQGLASAYVKGGMDEADKFAGLSEVDRIKVTGHAYSWMTDKDYYNPGGNFIKITDKYEGSLGGNRFFTLKELRKN